ncbi:twin transmembrane helix small protein [Hahella ganghwensis]|uniref:twin transmembrane helix small protein n=1 Tax=Hahella ganghwensis TaxID=286420 RepID=UPI0003744CE8|nr:twin transmembrane helix small protein [Hahella ganghwensis]
MKILIGLLLIGAIGSLFSGLFFLVKDTSSSDRTAKAMTFRVGFSLVLILLVIILLATGHLELNPTPY